MASKDEKGDVEVYHYSASSSRDVTEEEQLFEMVELSGVPLDRELFKVVLELLKLNVAPTNILSVLKTLRSQDSQITADDFLTPGTTSTKGSHDVTVKSRDSASKPHHSTKGSHDPSRKSHATSKRSHDPSKPSDKSKTERTSKHPKQTSGRTSKHRTPSTAT